MAITWGESEKIGRVTILHVTSDLTPAPVYFHWYRDGAWVGVTEEGSLAVTLEVGEQERIDCQDTLDPDYDGVANAPAGYPSRRTLSWCASASTDVAHYRIEQDKDGGGYSEIARIEDDGRWSFAFVTAALTDLSTYTWKVYPVDAAGNDGTPITIGPEKIVRTPDAPDWDFTFSPVTDKVTFAEA